MTVPSSTIAFAANRAFVLPVAVAIASLASHYSGPITVVSDDIDGEDRDLVERAALPNRVDWLRPPAHKVRQMPRGSLSAAFYRLLLPELLPAFDRVLYLDGDVLVRRSLDDLVAADLHGRPLGAVRNMRAPWLCHDDGLVAWQHMALDPSLDYLNSGVLLMDAAAWRHEGLGDQVIEVAGRLGDIGLLGQMFGDQDALNATVAGNWTTLDPGWNQHPLVFGASGNHHLLLTPPEIDQLRSDPAIVHYIGRSKPWQALCRHPFADEWRAIARSLLGPEWQPENRSTLARVSGRLTVSWAALTKR